MPSSFDRLRDYLGARAALTPADVAFVRSIFVDRRLGKGEILQSAGEPARCMAFVARGCLRSYAIDATGKVHVLRFAPEDWWLSDSARCLNGEPAELFIDAIEESDVLVTDHDSHQRMLDRVPGIAAAYRTALQRLGAAKDKHLVKVLSATAEARYLDFAARYPTLLQRVPLRMLASYLGMSPETLSRVRKKLSVAS